ncbi:hypothetical protein [Streptomyces sp. NPDC046685]|uniref:hypothetical protein n=1 Tax=Streptomyces sp. NPDC046685 TaxID=3157202 RepID=UPI0033E48A86
MDLNWYIVRRILVLGRLIGHDLSPEERAEERESCQHLARQEEVDSSDLDIAYTAAISAWWGAVMAAIALAALALFLVDKVHTVFGALVLVSLLSLGISLALILISVMRDAMLDRAGDSDPDTWTGRIAARLSRPRAYDFWLAAAASVWPALWASGFVGG